MLWRWVETVSHLFLLPDLSVCTVSSISWNLLLTWARLFFHCSGASWCREAATFAAQKSSWRCSAVFDCANVRHWLDGQLSADLQRHAQELAGAHINQMSRAYDIHESYMWPTVSRGSSTIASPGLSFVLELWNNDMHGSHVVIRPECFFNSSGKSSIPSAVRIAEAWLASRL